MKATISFQFDLPEQTTEYNAAVNAQDSMAVLSEIDRIVRNQLKYGDVTGDREALMEVQELVLRLL